MGNPENKNEQAKGKVKQAAGDLTGDDDLRREGKVDETVRMAKDKLRTSRTRPRTPSTR